MRSYIFAFAGLLPPAMGAMEFINPPPYVTTSDYSRNPTYAEGESVEVAWSDGAEGEQAIVKLWRRHPEVVVGPLNEYKILITANVTRFSWVVPDVDIDVSNLFFFSLHQALLSPDITADSVTLHFNITENADTKPPSADSTTSVSTTSSTTPSSTTSSTPIEGSVEDSAKPLEEPTKPPSKDGLGKAATIGLSVGIPCAIILGVAAGWYFFGRRKTRNVTATEPAQHSGYPPVNQGQQYQQWEPVELSAGKSKPAELYAPTDRYI